MKLIQSETYDVLASEAIDRFTIIHSTVRVITNYILLELQLQKKSEIGLKTSKKNAQQYADEKKPLKEIATLFEYVYH